MSMFSGQGLGNSRGTAEIASSDIAEDYPKTSLLANVVTRIVPPGKKEHVGRACKSVTKIKLGEC